MKFVLSGLLLCSSVWALASPPKTKEACSEEKPVVTKAAPVVRKKAPKPKATPAPVVQQTPAKPQPVDACCDKGSSKQNQIVAQDNNQQVTINVRPATTRRTYNPRKIVERVVERRTVRTVHVVDPNRLFLLLGMSKTDFSAKADCCVVKTDKDWQPDFGVGYMRDVNAFSFGAIVTTSPAAYFAVGINW